MLVPNSQFLLEFVRPEFLMLRTIARGLILWQSVVPSTKWINSHIPQSILPFCLVRPCDDHPQNLDYETMNQGYCNIVSGAAFVIGLRFAGSHNREAFEVRTSFLLPTRMWGTFLYATLTHGISTADFKRPCSSFDCHFQPLDR